MKADIPNAVPLVFSPPTTQFLASVPQIKVFAEGIFLLLIMNSSPKIV